MSAAQPRSLQSGSAIVIPPHHLERVTASVSDLRCNCRQPLRQSPLPRALGPRFQGTHPTFSIPRSRAACRRQTGVHVKDLVIHCGSFRSMASSASVTENPRLLDPACIQASSSSSSEPWAMSAGLRRRECACTCRRLRLGVGRQCLAGDAGVSFDRSPVPMVACSIGAPGFEPGTSCSQSRRATGLRHTPCFFRDNT
jgi:hypothetical protein